VSKSGRCGLVAVRGSCVSSWCVRDLLCVGEVAGLSMAYIGLGVYLVVVGSGCSCRHQCMGVGARRGRTCVSVGWGVWKLEFGTRAWI